MPLMLLNPVSSQALLLSLVFLGIVLYVEAIEDTGDNSAVLSADARARHIEDALQAALTDAGHHVEVRHPLPVNDLHEHCQRLGISVSEFLRSVEVEGEQR